MAKPKRKAVQKTSPPTSPKADWDRPQFTVRLTAARRERMRAVADGMPSGSTPNDALDRAVELALASRDEARGIAAISIVESMERLADAGDASRRREAAAIRSDCAATLAEVRRLSELISAVAAPPNESFDGDGWERDGGDEARAQSLRSWLEGAASGKGAPIVAVGRWRSKTRLSDALVSMAFEVSEQGRSERSLVAVEPLDASSPMARTDEAGAIRLECSRLGDAWSVEVRRLNPDRSIGPAICAIRV